MERLSHGVVIIICATLSLRSVVAIKIPHKSSAFTQGLQVAFCKSLVTVHITPGQFGNEGFTLKTHQMFSVHTTQEEFKNATVNGSFWICV